jgi:hypothetical protein
MSQSNTQLTIASKYETSRLVFSKPEIETIPNNNSKATPIEYQRVKIQTRNPDGTIGDLILSTSEVFSYGVSENIGQDGTVAGHVMPLCLWHRDRDLKKCVPTDEEKEWTDTFDKIADYVKSHMISIRGELTKYSEYEEVELAVFMKKFNPLYWKKEKGKVVPGTGPILYAKLIENRKKETIITKFYDYENNPIQPLDIMGQMCHVVGAVRIESVFIGGLGISLQVKLYEAEVKLLETNTMKRLIQRPVAGKLLGTVESTFEKIQIDNENDKGSDVGSLEDDTPAEEDAPVEEVVPVATPAKKRQVKKVVKVAKE